MSFKFVIFVDNLAINLITRDYKGKMNINWEAVSAIAGLLGALGVIVTLIYLAAQIRQNNKQLRGVSDYSCF